MNRGKTRVGRNFLIGLFWLACSIATASGQQPHSKKSAPLDVGVEAPETSEKQILPNDLLLRCEGHVTEADASVNATKFDTVLKLTNGKLSDTQYSSYSIDGCFYPEFGSGGIQCLERMVSKKEKGYELREQRVFIARATGEYSHYLEIRSLKTKDDFGSLKRLAQRTGVCSASKPIF
ncbi:hypothetical protein A1D31_30075 [Bradyrhizobium liaoningense]|nr:hypothetical protein A1D31_30075 [Bradyrhizobium liaoningense]